MTFLRPCYLGAQRDVIKTRETERWGEGSRLTRQPDSHPTQDEQDASIIDEKQQLRAQTCSSGSGGRLGSTFWIQPAGGAKPGAELQGKHTSSADTHTQPLGGSAANMEKTNKSHTELRGAAPR